MSKEKKDIETFMKELKNKAASWEVLIPSVVSYFNDLESKPSNAMGVVKELDNLVTKKIEEREKSTLLELKAVLEYEYLTKTREMEVKFEKEKDKLGASNKLLINELEKKVDDRYQEIGSKNTLINELRKDLRKTKKEYILELFEDLKSNTYSSSKNTYRIGNFFNRHTVTIPTIEILEDLESMIKIKGLI